LYCTNTKQNKMSSLSSLTLSLFHHSVIHYNINLKQQNNSHYWHSNFILVSRWLHRQPIIAGWFVRVLHWNRRAAGSISVEAKPAIGRFPLTRQDRSERSNCWMEHKTFGLRANLIRKFGSVLTEIHFR
jgi:hypothetical protein